MKLFDTHAHLDDEQFSADRRGVIERALAAGVGTMIAVGTTASSSENCVRLAAEYDGVYAAVGIQPNYVAEAAEGDWDRIVSLANDPNCHAIGETGLDRHWDYSPFDLQQDYFDRHLRLSHDTGKPFIVHMRDCDADILEMLRAAAAKSSLRGVMHSFTGDSEMARACWELGMHISFAGMLTFKKSDDLRRTAGIVPDDRLLIETDAPYLSPHPHRGQRPNEPALLVHTADCLAQVKSVSLDEIAQLTTNNAVRLFCVTN